MSGPNWLGLLKWSLSHSDGTSPSIAHPLGEDDKLFLENVMKDLIRDEPLLLCDILKKFTNFIDSGIKIENENEMIELLEEVQNMIDQIDMANIFVKFGGIHVLKCLIGNDILSDKIKCLACVVIGELAQNNPQVQDQMYEHGMIDELCVVSLSCSSSKLCIKSLYGISCTIRGHKNSEYRFFHDLNGPAFLLRLLQKNDSGCNSKVLFLLSALLSSDFSTYQMITSYGDLLFEVCYPFLLLSFCTSESELVLQILTSLTQTHAGKRYLQQISSRVLQELEQKYQRTGQEGPNLDEDEFEERKRCVLESIMELMNQIKICLTEDLSEREIDSSVPSQQSCHEPLLQIGG